MNKAMQNFQKAFAGESMANRRQKKPGMAFSAVCYGSIEKGECPRRNLDVRVMPAKERSQTPYQFVCKLCNLYNPKGDQR